MSVARCVVGGSGPKSVARCVIGGVVLRVLQGVS